MTAPVLTSIAPNTGSVGDRATTLTATGTGFDNTSKVVFDGTVTSTTYVSATSLTAPRPELAATGLKPVLVRGPGGDSAPVNFTVGAVPALGPGSNGPWKNPIDEVWGFGRPAT